MWVWGSWLSLGVKPEVSSAWIFYHLRGHHSADSSREDQAHEGGLSSGRGGDSGTAMGKIFQGTYGNWMPSWVFFFAKSGCFLGDPCY